MFSVVHAVILRPLPYPDPDRLVELSDISPANAGFRVSALNYLSWAERSRSFDALAAFGGVTVNLTGEGDAERLIGTAITASMFRVLGLQPIAGRPLRDDDERPGSDRVALLSETFWQRRFGRNPAIIGQSIVLDGQRHQVIGVVPRAFRDVGRARISSAEAPQIFVPLTIDRTRETRGNHTWRVVGRLRPGVSLEQARDEMRRIAAGMEHEFPATNQGWGVRLQPVSEAMLESRRRELALRAALGASPGRLVRQLLTESVCLASVSGACGLLVSILALSALRVWIPSTLPRVEETRIDAAVVAFGLLVSTFSGLFFGVLPARRATRINLLPALSESGKGLFSPSHPALRQGLVVAQMAFATMLLIVAALFIQSFLRLQHVAVGFDAEGVMTRASASSLRSIPTRCASRLSMTNCVDRSRAGRTFRRSVARSPGTTSQVPMQGTAASPWTPIGLSSAR